MVTARSKYVNPDSYHRNCLLYGAKLNANSFPRFFWRAPFYSRHSETFSFDAPHRRLPNKKIPEFQLLVEASI